MLLIAFYELVSLSLINTKVLDLEPLDDHTGAQLLQKLTNANNGGNLSLAVSHRLGGLPLAIAQMAGILRREYMAFNDFLEVYKDDTENQMESPTGFTEIAERTRS